MKYPELLIESYEKSRSTAMYKAEFDTEAFVNRKRVKIYGLYKLENGAWVYCGQHTVPVNTPKSKVVNTIFKNLEEMKQWGVNKK